MLKEWDVVMVIIALVGLAVAIGAPVLKLNTSITRLIVKLNNLDEGLDELTERNRESHKRIYGRLEGHDKELSEHNLRIFALEKGKEKQDNEEN